MPPDPLLFGLATMLRTWVRSIMLFAGGLRHLHAMTVIGPNHLYDIVTSCIKKWCHVLNVGWKFGVTLPKWVNVWCKHTPCLLLDGTLIIRKKLYITWPRWLLLTQGSKTSSWVIRLRQCLRLPRLPFLWVWKRHSPLPMLLSLAVLLTEVGWT